MSINIEGMVSKEDQENAASLKRVFLRRVVNSYAK